MRLIIYVVNMYLYVKSMFDVFWIRQNGFGFHPSRAYQEPISNIQPVALPVFGFMQTINWGLEFSS